MGPGSALLLGFVLWAFASSPFVRPPLGPLVAHSLRGGGIRPALRLHRLEPDIETTRRMGKFKVTRTLMVCTLLVGNGIHT